MSDLTQNLILGNTYDEAIAQISDAVTSVEMDALRAYWGLGELVVQFAEAAKSRRYGKKTMQDLATDLVAKGPLSRIGNPVRYLHWARTIREKLPQEKLVVYVRRGLGITMVKRLVSIDPVVAQTIEEKLFSGKGGLPTVVDFDQMVDDEIKLANARLVHPEAEPEELNATVLAANKGKSDDHIKVEIVDSTSDDDVFGPAKTTPATAQPAARADAPGKADKTDKPKKSTPSAPERPVSPLKSIKAIDNAAQKILASVGDALIAFNAVEKVGFDSDKAKGNFDSQVNATRASLKDLLAVLPEFLKSTSRD